MISRVYNAQKLKPVKDDWFLTVQKDKDDIQLLFSDDEMKRIKKIKFKQIIKVKIKKKALEYLLEVKSSHSKGKDAKFSKLEMQKYISSNNFTKAQKSLLYNLRFRMTKAKMNFKNMLAIGQLSRLEERTRHQSFFKKLKILTSGIILVY